MTEDLSSERLVWGITWSAAAATELNVWLSRLGSSVRSDIRCMTIAMESNRVQHLVSTVPWQPLLAAVILVLEPEGVRQETFREWVAWCISYIGRREDFRVFVRLRHMNRNDLLYHANSCDDKLLKDLFDTVEISESSDDDEKFNVLSTFLSNHAEIQDGIKIRNFRLYTARYFGYLAAGIQCVAAALSLVAGVAVFLNQAQALTWPLTVRYGVAAVSASLYFMLFSVCLFDFSRILENQFMKGAGLSVKAFLSAIFGIWITGVPSELHVPTSWFSLGVAGGVLVDIARRAGLQARKMQNKIDPSKISDRNQPLPPDLVSAIAGRRPDPLSCPVIPQLCSNVFISYTRSSEWASGIAYDLYRKLEKAKVPCFLDSKELGEGCNWRAQLNRRLAYTNLFISIVDLRSSERKWPAAELEAALACRRINGIPDILVLKAAGTVTHPDSMPVFKAVLERVAPSLSECGPRVIEVRESTVETVASSIGLRHYESAAVLTGQFTGLAMRLFSPLLVVAWLLGTSGGIIGPVAGVVAIGHFALGWQFIRYGVPGFLTGLGLVAAYVLGFSLRLSLASRYEVNSPAPKVLAAVNLLGAIGLSLLISLVLPKLSAIVWGWSAVMVLTGWLFGCIYIHFSVLGKPGFLRRLPD